MWRIALSQIQLALAPSWATLALREILRRRHTTAENRSRVRQSQSRRTSLEVAAHPAASETAVVGRTSAATRHRHGGSIYGVG